MSALGAVALLWVFTTVGLQALARHAEATGIVYPYKSEDWLRYLLPSLWPADSAPLLLLTGPSTVRENLLVEDFAEAFPDYRIFQGGLSLGTLADVIASLAYVERVHGTKALPDAIVLGVSPRFMADIPDHRPFAMGLDRYSRHYRIASSSPSGYELERKSARDGLRDEARFLAFKQQTRYWAALAWLGATLVGPDLSERLPSGAAARFGALPLVPRLPRRLADLGIYGFAMEVASPYKYRGADPMSLDGLRGWLDDPESWWHDVYHWDASAQAATTRSRVEALLELAERYGIDLWVVNLPERALSRARYAPGLSRHYDELLRDAFAGVPFLDLRCLLDDDEFHDAEHARQPGGHRMTQQVIRFMKDAHAGRAGAHPPPAGAHSRGATHPPSSGCVDLP